MLTYKDVNILLKKKALKADAVKYLFKHMSCYTRKIFTRCFLNLEPGIELIRQFFTNHSDIAIVITKIPGSAMAFRPLYEQTERNIGIIDYYFIKSIAGQQIHQRLMALVENIPYIIKKNFNITNRNVLLDNIGAGFGHDMILVLKNNPDLAGNLFVRNIEPDKKVNKISKKMVEEYGLTDSFSFIESKFHEALLSRKLKKRADIALLIGILCDKKKENCVKWLRNLKRYYPIIIFSLPLEEMVISDPVTDFLMRVGGWRMNYKKPGEAVEIAKAAGWKPIFIFYDKPRNHYYTGHHHCMIVAARE